MSDRRRKATASYQGRQVARVKPDGSRTENDLGSIARRSSFSRDDSCGSTGALSGRRRRNTRPRRKTYRQPPRRKAVAVAFKRFGAHHACKRCRAEHSTVPHGRRGDHNISQSARMICRAGRVKRAWRGIIAILKGSASSMAGKRLFSNVSTASGSLAARQSSKFLPN